MKSLKKLSRIELSKIIGGMASVESVDSAASCTKDCGGGKSVTCEGSTCTTTDYGCYDGNGGGPNHKYCSQA